MGPHQLERMSRERADGGSLPVLDGSTLVAGVLDGDKGSAEKSVEETEGKADAVYSKDAVALVICAVHFYIVVAPFLDELDGAICAHDPGENRVEGKYDLQGMSGGAGVMIGRTANPTRVAMDELQLHDLQNMDAGRE